MEIPVTPRPLLHQQIADRIERQIASGVLAAGDRAPSLREVSRNAGVSLATVTQAYLNLERRGLLHARPRSGFYVTGPAAPALPAPSAQRVRYTRPRSISAEAIDATLAALARTDLVSLNSAMTDSARQLHGRLNRLTRDVLREHPDLPNRLVPPPGDQALRIEIARRASLHGAATDPDQVVITAGALEAIMLSLQTLCRAGETVLVETPTYFGILQLLEHLQLKVVEVRNQSGHGIDVDRVEDLVLRTPLAAAVLMPNFNNPTGALTPDAAKERLVRILARHSIPVIEDDIYGDLYHGTIRPKPLRAFPGGDTVITCGSVSKSIAIGYRVGWAISNEHAAEIARLKYCSSVATASLQQQVIARYFARGDHERHLRRIREFQVPNSARFAAAIARYFPAGTRLSEPAGGVVLWVQLPEPTDGLKLFHHALAERIGIAPGLIFSATAEYRNCIRISTGLRWTRDVEHALRVLGALAGQSPGG